jgi:hypothetical protein
MEIVRDNTPEEQYPEIANILEAIVNYKDEDPVRRSDYFRVIQKHTEKALKKLDHQPLILKVNEGY